MAPALTTSLIASPIPVSPSPAPLKLSRRFPPTISMAFTLKPLPFDMDSLEPHMSRKTLEFHWGKHHRAYVDNLNKQLSGTNLEGATLDEVVKMGYNNGNPTPYFNNAGQVWNHDFFWQSISPDSGKKPDGELLKLIERDFGSFETFADEFKQAAATQFGSGWAWLSAKATDPLVEDKFAKLVVEKTPNAINPLILGSTPLLTIDVWEHAYYLDYQNRRPDYIATFFNELINWEMVAARLEKAKAFLNFYDPVVPQP